jgi:Ner family transcriptional regulator
MSKKTRRIDRRAAKIKYHLAELGLSCAELDRRNRFYYGRCANTLHEPDEDGEGAIAKALGKLPQEIWPERYDATGVRFLPQPTGNYRMRLKGESRRNGEAA